MLRKMVFLQVNALQGLNYKEKDIVFYVHRVDRVHRLFLQSSDSRLPHPLTRMRVCPPFGWGGGHSLGGDGVGGGS